MSAPAGQNLSVLSRRIDNIRCCPRYVCSFALPPGRMRNHCESRLIVFEDGCYYYFFQLVTSDLATDLHASIAC